jgi:hypothetical protein
MRRTQPGHPKPTDVSFWHTAGPERGLVRAADLVGGAQGAPRPEDAPAAA